ncbi:MAG: Phenylacetic acid catabolic protein [Candidatus Thermoplasmatota archaeon]|nr:Phenylacetic acid catabolic protein [Candidatus Thermoplasmatota archaeon]
MSDVPPSSKELLLALGDANLAAGVQYGLWIERSPTVEEQIALSSMSQDKLGHARAYYQLLEEHFDEDAVALQYDRDLDAFAWPTGWTAPLPTWQHLVLAQVLFSRALMSDISNVDPGSPAGGLVDKISQEESWHTRHGDAWLASLADGAHGSTEDLQAALDELWPHAVVYLGLPGQERFPGDVDNGSRTVTDTEAREAYLEEVGAQLEAAGLNVPSVTPSDKLLAELTDAVAENRLELQALLQDPEGREIASL